jgi:hypothetical protein
MPAGHTDFKVLTLTNEMAPEVYLFPSSTTFFTFLGSSATVRVVPPPGGIESCLWKLTDIEFTHRRRSSADGWMSEIRGCLNGNRGESNKIATVAIKTVGASPIFDRNQFFRFWEFGKQWFLV